MFDQKRVSVVSKQIVQRTSYKQGYFRRIVSEFVKLIVKPDFPGVEVTGTKLSTKRPIKSD